MFPQRPQPVGPNEPVDIDRRPIWRVYNGDDLRLRARVTLVDEPADPDNSVLTFILSNQRFTPQDYKVWEGTWNNGILEVDHVEHPGLIEVRIPMEISDELRRGSFLYSLSVENKLGEHRRTVLEGSMLVEYAPTTPIQDIPYKD